jgi:hypothetical protein
LAQSENVDENPEHEISLLFQASKDEFSDALIHLVCTFLPSRKATGFNGILIFTLHLAHAEIIALKVSFQILRN